jgi:hypothetical protein
MPVVSPTTPALSPGIPAYLLGRQDGASRRRLLDEGGGGRQQLWSPMAAALSWLRSSGRSSMRERTRVEGAAAHAIILAPSRRDHQQRRSPVDESGVRAEEVESAMAEFLVGTDESAEAVERGSRGRRQPREGEAELCGGGGGGAGRTRRLQGTRAARREGGCEEADGSMSSRGIASRRQKLWSKKEEHEIEKTGTRCWAHACKLSLTGGSLSREQTQRFLLKFLYFSFF